MASTTEAAIFLGSRGGKARARRLDPSRRREIASQGGKARGESLRLIRLVDDNFKYLRASKELAGSGR